MGAKAKTSAGGQKLFNPGKPKRSAQGQGKNSKPSHRRKLMRGQGK